MEDQLITFETAKLVKESGFDISTVYYYDFIGFKCSGGSSINWNKSKETIYSAPTQSLLQKWLRDEHGIHIELLIEHSGDVGLVVDIWYRAFLWKLGNREPGSHEDLGAQRYELILEVALQEALKLIK